MEDHSGQTTTPGRSLIIAGLVLAWAASIGLALELKNLLTPGTYPVGSDPSGDIAIAAFCFFLILLGGLLAWRGNLVRTGRFSGQVSRTVNLATLATVLALAITGVAGILIKSANAAVARQYQEYIPSRPRPDYSYPEFPTPALPQTTPTHDPSARYLAGPLLYALDGLKAGNIWISLSPDGKTVNSSQAYLERIECSVQEGDQTTTYAVEQSEQLISGPLPVQDDRFYGAEDSAVIHGVVVSANEVHGTLYLRYIDPATGRACDLGNFTWTAAPTP
ncbi:MAG TPA: hypothetical protein VMT46_11995 [Anaerolineaceae bacterium]|nr:hypothetical protein [Anaerolineaceae bacterium]